MARYVFYLTLLVGVVVYAIMLYRSSTEVDENLFREAEIYCLDQKWDQARTALIDVLRENPLHAGAHFYLGRAYMFGSEFRPIMAEGEFLTALSLFRDQDRGSPIDRFAPEYFEMMCYVEAAKANLIQIDLYLGAGASLADVQNLVADTAYYADRAKRIAPNAPEVRDLMSIVDSMRPRGNDAEPLRPEQRIQRSPRVNV